MPAHQPRTVVDSANKFLLNVSGQRRELVQIGHSNLSRFTLQPDDERSEQATSPAAEQVQTHPQTLHEWRHLIDTGGNELTCLVACHDLISRFLTHANRCEVFEGAAALQQMDKNNTSLQICGTQAHIMVR